MELLNTKSIILLALLLQVVYSVNGQNSCGCSYDYATGCSTGPTQGARNLATYLRNTYSGRTEIFNCRKVRGRPTVYSLHSEGRAVDLYPGSQQAFTDLIALACSSGIQEVIYNRQIWTNGRGTRSYTGTNPHTDHVHVGLNKCGATNYV